MGRATRNALLLSVAAVLLIAAGLRLTFSHSTAGVPARFTADAVCLACQQDVTVTPKLSEPAPWKCPKCGEQAAYTWLYCPRCEVKFIPELVRVHGRPPRQPMIPTCPRCGGQHVTAYWAKDPEQPAQGRLPLPKWP
jgi:hypothetical protein